MSEINDAIQKYEEIYQLLTVNNFIVSEYKTINYGLQFTAQKSAWSGIVRIYQNKQGKIKIDLSQLDETENSRLMKSFFEKQHEHLSKQITEALPNKLLLPVIGSDESGKGDYFGPLVSACIYVDTDAANQLTTLGVKDSKILSEARIIEIARKIRSICQDKFTIIEISPEKYNQIYAKLKSQKKTLNDLLAWSHAKAIEELLSKVECQVAIVDQFADENLLLEKLQEKGKVLKIIQAHRAESHIAVAAASILARERFVNKLTKLEKQYQIRLPKGSSKEVISAAKQLVGKYGNEILGKIAKTHFKSTNEILS